MKIHPICRWLKWYSRYSAYMYACAHMRGSSEPAGGKRSRGGGLGVHAPPESNPQKRPACTLGRGVGL